MVKIIFILLVSFFVIPFSFDCIKDNPCQAVEIVYSFPVTSDEGETAIKRDTSMIFFYQNFKIYKVQFLWSQEINDILVGFGHAYMLVGFDTTKKKGFSARYFSDNKLKVISVDSFLNTRHNSSFVDKLYERGRFVREGMNGFLSKRVFCFNGTNDTMYLYFNNNLSDFTTDYSLSQKLDSLTKSKLSRIELLFEKTTNAYGRKLDVNLRTLNYEFIEKKDIDKDSVNLFISHMKQAYQEIH